MRCRSRRSLQRINAHIFPPYELDSRKRGVRISIPSSVWMFGAEMADAVSTSRPRWPDVCARKQVLSACAMSSTKTSLKTILRQRNVFEKRLAPHEAFYSFMMAFQQKPMKTFKPIPAVAKVFRYRSRNRRQVALRFLLPVAVFVPKSYTPFQWPDFS